MNYANLVNMISKSTATHIVSLSLIGIGFFTPLVGPTIMMVGFFAISGSITNWIAIHMLFEKVPFLIGSGVIENRFSDFKVAIRNLIVDQFFSEGKIGDMIKSFVDSPPTINAESIANGINHDKIFNELVTTIEESKFGSFLPMVGGRKALEPLKEPIKNKTTVIVKDIITEEAPKLFSSTTSPLNSVTVRKKIIELVDLRLKELTPQMVKKIIQDMIQQHLGWLVVWGGFFGGLIGLIMGLVKLI